MPHAVTCSAPPFAASSKRWQASACCQLQAGGCNALPSQFRAGCIAQPAQLQPACLGSGLAACQVAGQGQQLRHRPQVWAAHDGLEHLQPLSTLVRAAVGACPGMANLTAGRCRWRRPWAPTLLYVGHLLIRLGRVPVQINSRAVGNQQWTQGRAGPCPPTVDSRPGVAASSSRGSCSMLRWYSRPAASGPMPCPGAATEDAGGSSGATCTHRGSRKHPAAHGACTADSTSCGPTGACF
jgi:hypothetical protein